MTLLLTIKTAVWRPSLSLAVILAALAPSPAQAETVQHPQTFVFVIDATNSMTSKVKGAVKLEMAKGAFTKSISASPRQANAAFLSFGDQPSRACEDVVDLVPLTPVEKSAAPIRNGFAKLEPKTSGKTPLLAAAAHAAQIIEGQGRGATGGVIIITDGGDDCSPAACQSAETFHAQHPDVTIHVISLRPDRIIGAQLQCITGATGGLFSEAQTEAQAAQAVMAAIRHVPAAPPTPELTAKAPVEKAPAAKAPMSTAATPPQTAATTQSTVPSEPTPAQQPSAAAPANPLLSSPQATAAPAELIPAQPTASTRSGPAPNVILHAVLAQGSAPLTQGVGWRIFTEKPASGKRSGREKVLWSGAGAEARTRLAPGSYYAEAVFGLIKSGAEITVPPSGEFDAVVPLNAGVINVRATGRKGGASLDRVFYRLFSEAANGATDPSGEIGRSSQAQAVFFVPAGRYRIAAEHGSAKAETPVTVTPGASLAVEVPMNAGELKLEAAVGAPASPPATNSAPQISSPETSSGSSAAPQFFYQIYAENPATPNIRSEIARSSAAAPSFDLPEGSYHVAVRYDLASAEKDVKITAGEQTRETLALNVGELSLSSRLAGQTNAANSVTHVIYRLPASSGGEPAEIARSPSTDRVFHLSSGLYRVVSQHGGLNARETADIAIKPGETQKVEFEHHAGEVRLVLSGRIGRRRSVAWTITDASGQTVAQSEDREPKLTLKSGSYKAEARMGSRTFAASFELGDNEKKTVSAAQ
jgi:Ca-activated chloride channel homolog